MQCVGCGGEIPRARRRDSKFCSDSCRTKFRKAYFASEAGEYPPGAHVYGMRVGRRVYVGFSAALRTRIRAFRAGCPEDATFIGARPGDKKLLEDFRARFAAARVNGAWYDAAPELTQWFQ
jgi:hypothetical protein